MAKEDMQQLINDLAQDYPGKKLIQVDSMVYDVYKKIIHYGTQRIIVNPSDEYVAWSHL